MFAQQKKNKKNTRWLIAEDVVRGNYQDSLIGAEQTAGNSYPMPPSVMIPVINSRRGVELFNAMLFDRFLEAATTRYQNWSRLLRLATLIQVVTVRRPRARTALRNNRTSRGADWRSSAAVRWAKTDGTVWGAGARMSRLAPSGAVGWPRNCHRPERASAFPLSRC